MSNSFNSFHQILSAQRKIEDRLQSHEHYFAHTHTQKEPELLAAHVNLVNEYFLRLVEAHRLEPVIDQLIQRIIPQPSVNDASSIENFVKSLFLNTIVFHDYGKINENFQTERMENNHFQKNNANGISSRHSILSAFLFVVEHIAKIQKLENSSPEIQGFLYSITYWLSNSILKHHASYIENDLPFDDDLLTKITPYLALIDCSVDHSIVRAIFNNYKGKLKQFSEHCFTDSARFPIYLLLKLNFSLLTAADYYATSDFMMGLKFSDLGLLKNTDIDRFSEQFKTSQDYNREFFANRDFFTNYPEEKLAQCSQENLNILRKKLLSETLQKLEQQSQKNVYFLEAPTGSGKTNLSMAIALKLLELDQRLNKIFYVFPFTTLITQTAKSIRETLGATNAEMVQLHSRSGFHQKHEADEDGIYGADKLNYLDNLFVNYPITLLTHIKFFDILKGNGKETTYLLHRLANSVVIIDELQSYPPLEWDKITLFIKEFADLFNMKFIVMSATLPKIDSIKINSIPQTFCPLIKDKNIYFHNPNFKNRVQFDFSLLRQQIDLESLSEMVLKKSEAYATGNRGKVKTIIEFIFKKTASEFYRNTIKKAEQLGYKVLVLSGTILEYRRREIIQLIKEKEPDKQKPKILLITTQVVEAGVDIDMDIGFKDRSLIDSDEQLAGRVNRNARPVPATVYLFKLDKAHIIYGTDLRYKILQEHTSQADYERILNEKAFDEVYEKVCERINRQNDDPFFVNLSEYNTKIAQLKMWEVHKNFKLIDQENITVFVPLEISAKAFSEVDLLFLKNLKCYSSETPVDGKQVWQAYLDIIHSKYDDFIQSKIEFKKIYSILSQFMFSIFAKSNQPKELLQFCNGDYWHKYGILYLDNWQAVYDYKSGIKDEKLKEPAFL